MSADGGIHSTAPRGDNIVLIGYRGAGKTTVGSRLAKRLGRPFVDVDDLIVRAQGRSIREIFEQSGETAFRTAEAEAIGAATQRRGQVISVGGGAVLLSQNRERLRAAGACVWLQASLDELLRRVAADPSTAEARPPLTSHPGADEIRMLLAQREVFYMALADARVETDGLDVDLIVTILAGMVPLRLKE